MLRKRIAELELENKQLKGSGGGTSAQMSASYGGRGGGSTMAQDKNWMNFGS